MSSGPGVRSREAHPLVARRLVVKERQRVRRVDGLAAHAVESGEEHRVAAEFGAALVEGVFQAVVDRLPPAQVLA